MESTARVIENNIIDIKPDALVKFDTTEKVIREAESLLDLKVTDNETRKAAGSDRVKINALINTVDRRRIDLKKERAAVIEEEGQAILGRLTTVKKHLNTEIQNFDTTKNAEKAEKMAAEKIRLDAIQTNLAGISAITKAAQAYGLTSEQINSHIEDMKVIPLTEEIYHEFLPEAERSVAQGIETLTALYDRIVQFEQAQAKMEAEQKAQAEIAAQQKAEAERLAKIAEEQEKARKEAEAAQAKADAEAKAERDAEAAKLAQEKAQIEADKAAIQAERDRMAAEAEKVAFAERVRWCESIGAEWYAADWNEAHNTNKEFDNKILIAKLKRWNEAIEINNQMDLGQAMADDIEAARLEELKPDKEKLLAFAETVGSLKIPDMKTDDGEIISSVVDSMLRDIVTFISDETGKF